jgi:hypothetical protein
MRYELSQCHNTGNWWICEVEEDGYRSIVRTLSADLTIEQANAYMKVYMAYAKLEDDDNE